MGQQKWFKFGIDLLLGSRLDEKMTFREQMFLPNNLSENLRESINTKTNKPLLQAPKTIIKPQPITANIINQITQPLVVFSALFLITVLLFFVTPKWLNRLAPLVFFIAGFLGLFLVFMWFGTVHNGTKNNWNIAWLNPLFILLILPFGKPIKRYLLWALLIINALILLGFALLPQAINVAAIPIILTLILLCWVRLSETENS